MQGAKYMTLLQMKSNTVSTKHTLILCGANAETNNLVCMKGNKKNKGKVLNAWTTIQYTSITFKKWFVYYRLCALKPMNLNK